MADHGSPADTGVACGCKIGRITEQYNLTDLDVRLASYWTGDADEQRSTRELATYVNQQILEKALTDANIPPKEGEIENTYRLLTDDNVSSGTRVQTQNELQRDGVPVERVESDFVSHQTVYNHLTDCLETSIERPSDEERLEQSEEKLGALQSRTTAVTTDTIDRLKQKEILEIGDFNVNTSVTVTCEDCFEEYTIRDLLEKQSCDCQQMGTNGD